MPIPASIAELVSGPGKLVSVGVTFLGAVFAILAEGYVGISAFVIVVLVLLVAELWKDANGLTAERDSARLAEQNTRSVLQQEQAKTREMATLEHEMDQTAQRVAWLENELRAQSDEPSRLLRVMAAHAGLIRMVRRHRELATGTRPARWTILGITIYSEQLAVVRCYAPDSDYADGEPVALIATDTGDIQATGQAAVEGQEIVAALALDSLPKSILVALEAHGEVQPDGYALELAGRAVRTYDGLTDEALDQLETELQSAASALAHNLQQRG